MTTRIENAKTFKALHRPGDPLALYNIWDAGGAKVLVKAGAKAVATGSWSVAAAHGYRDGEQIPLDLLLTIVGRIADSVDIPLSVDFEGGYAAAPDAVAANVSRLIAAGAIGINFEDQIVGGDGLYPIADQAARIAAIRAAAARAGAPIFINARTDLFLKTKDGHGTLIEDALARQAAYAEAGADGFFVPGLTDADLIKRICDASTLPVNVMMLAPLEKIADVARLGVARASFGPAPYRLAIADFSARVAALA